MPFGLEENIQYSTINIQFSIENLSKQSLAFIGVVNGQLSIVNGQSSINAVELRILEVSEVRSPPFQGYR